MKIPAIRGLDCQLLINVSTAATEALRHATPTFIDFRCVRDATLTLENETADSTCRGSNGFGSEDIVKQALTIEGTAVQDSDDAAYEVVKLAAWNKTVLDVIVLDGPRGSADSDGFRVQVQVTSWSQAQPSGDILTNDFTFKPARSAFPPELVSGPIA